MKIRSSILIVILLSISFIAKAQLLSVTATLTDSDGQTWNNATCTIQTYNSTGSINYYNGTPIPLNPSCTVNSSGVLSASLYNTNTLAPASAQYRFTIQSQTSAAASTFLSPVTASNMSSALSALIIAPRFPTTVGALGYLDVEALPTFLGGNYYNVTNSISRQCTAITAGACTTWQNFGGGGGSGNVTGSGLTSLHVVLGAGSSAIQVDPDFFTDGAGNATATSYTATGAGGVGAYGLGTEGTDPALGATGKDYYYADSTAHRWKMNNNNGGSVNVMSQSDVLLSAQMPSLTGDVSNSGLAVTVTGFNGVPKCTGLSPSNGQYYEYTTGGSPSPCISAASSTIPAQYKTWLQSDGPVSNAALASSGFPATPMPINTSGVTLTITAIYCTVDAGTGTTFTLTDNSGNNLLGASGTCSTTGTSIAVSGTHYTLASGTFMKDTVTPDGTAKAITITVGGTY